MVHCHVITFLSFSFCLQFSYFLLALAQTNGWDQCAQNEDGTLKDSRDIDFGPDPGAADDALNLSQPGNIIDIYFFCTESNVSLGPSARPARNKNQRMMQALNDEKEGNVPTVRKRKPRGTTTKTKGKGTASDAEDLTYSGDETDSESDSDKDIQITTEDVSHL